MEYDTPDPPALAALKAGTRLPIASLESIYGRRGYAPFLAAGAVDVAVIDVSWNGFAEAVRVANLAESHDLTVAPHNFYGPLADLMAAHFCASIPNVEIMEIEGDDVPWKYQLLTHAPRVAHGTFTLPARPGWGSDIDEEAVAEHPWPGVNAH